ncbi:thiol reductant ABC exporter subunit CydC [Companilactobacillus crustorum]|uniref:Cytochrome bd biosynthesis ABC-type transporter, ATPase and permease component n=3 Tax=Companilactobacillus TaxID=2767879 RepID=A0A837RIQ1_9LACO|nr:thiol reductant ABC exporter subunit CydC [Companilactobacillus crustorum]APU70394.1 ATP-binding/permease protein CydD [Companilactobacillus crustorum]KRK43476.1 cytochrome bd biosynthesis ABC-type transporter, ATPase and permease component [Companilactobacillus crustorum JCM 15951]KRO21013.1 cytochrome bd biosynthesis ABC-type transporter, ATPase and permease component [Companilactobacillus crustorum]GEO75949.1 thiol reductant ABC exporter subunit CydC [Companilactobacillus crustorum]
MNFFKTFKSDTWVKPYIKQYKGLLITALLLGLMTSFCAAALMFTSGYTIDKAATHPINILLIYIPILLTRAFGIGRPVFKYIERLMSHNWVLKVTSDLRTRLYKNLEGDASFFTEHHKTGDIMGLLSEDISHLQNLYLRTVFPAVISYLLTIVASLALGVFNPSFGFFVFLLLFVEVFLVPLISVTIESARRAYQKEVKNDLYIQLTDNILGVDDWVVSGRKKDFKNLTSKNIKSLDSSKNKSKAFRRNRDFGLQLVFVAIVVCFLIFTNLTMTHNQAQANFVSAVVLAIFPLSDAIIPVSQGFEEWPLYKDSINRLNTVQPVTNNLPKQVTINPKDFNSISLNNVTFEYDSNSPILIKNFSQNIHKGEKLALLGPSGIGKTTILQLILGDLSPQQGQIQVNDFDISQIQENREQIFSVLNQKPFLFNTTLMNNVRLGNEQKSDAAIKQAIERVGLKDLIESLPDKYNTIVGENGARFSGGEQERIALARILLQDAPVVLLDEPTVGLDPITENELLETFFDVLQDKTIIWVTHHLQGIKHVDHVVFMNDKGIEMEGSPQQLYQTNSHFKELYQMDQGI